LDPRLPHFLSKSTIDETGLQRFCPKRRKATPESEEPGFETSKPNHIKLETRLGFDEIKPGAAVPKPGCEVLKPGFDFLFQNREAQSHSHFSKNNSFDWASKFCFKFAKPGFKTSKPNRLGEKSPDRRKPRSPVSKPRSPSHLGHKRTQPA